MNIYRYLHKSLLTVATAGLIAALGTPSARADEAAGAVVGIITNAAKLPIAHATVTARRVDGGAIRATVSGSDGVYSFGDLPAGLWSITSQAEGLPEVAEPAITVAPSKATRHDIVVNVREALPAAEAPALAATAKEAARKVTAAAPAAPTVPEALLAPEPGPEVDTVTPFANDGDIGWLNGNTREKSPIFDTKFFTPEIRLDVNYLQSLNRPVDHTVQRVPDRTGELRRRFPLERREGPLSLDVRHVRDHHAAQ